VIDAGKKKSDRSVGLSQATPNEKLRQRVQRAAALCRINCRMRNGRRTREMKLGQLAQRSSQALHLNRIVRSQLPAHV